MFNLLDVTEKYPKINAAIVFKQVIGKLIVQNSSNINLEVKEWTTSKSKNEKIKEKEDVLYATNKVMFQHFVKVLSLLVLQVNLFLRVMKD